MLRSNWCNYADGYILVKETIIIIGAGNAAAPRQADERDEKEYLKTALYLLYV